MQKEADEILRVKDFAEKFVLSSYETELEGLSADQEKQMLQGMTGITSLANKLHDEDQAEEHVLSSYQTELEGVPTEKYKEMLEWIEATAP